MKKGLTELVFILDKSGSMAGLKDDTIGGFNSMLEKQKGQEGECRITTVLFDHQCSLLHDRIDIGGVSAMSERDYCPGGMTALLDAIGMAIHKIETVQQSTAPEYQAEKVLCVIITDGMENSSREYKAQQVKDAVKRKTEQDGWEFIFLGANIDAVKTASHLGIQESRAQDFCADGDGMELNFDAMADVVTSMRSVGCVPQAWKKEIHRDYTTRGKKK